MTAAFDGRDGAIRDDDLDIMCRGIVRGDELICAHCDEQIGAGELSPVMNVPTHRNCALRMVVGSAGHQRRECSCFGVEDTSERGLTKREAADAAAREYLRRHRIT